jgi:hypothetical protein
VTLQELDQIVREYLPPSHRHEIEAYTLTREESWAYYRRNKRPCLDGFHADIYSTHAPNVIETIFVSIETRPATARLLVSIALQKIQERRQGQTVIILSDVIKAANVKV